MNYDRSASHIDDAPSTDVPQQKMPGSVVDLFCGAGGLSHGFKLEGFQIAAGFDIDEKCRYPFEQNNDAPFRSVDVGEIDPADLDCEFSQGTPRILVGCAPCQPFSKYSQGREDGRWQLLEHFSRLIKETKPDIVSMENVPRLPEIQGFFGVRQFRSCIEKRQLLCRLDDRLLSRLWNTSVEVPVGVARLAIRTTRGAQGHPQANELSYS